MTFHLSQHAQCRLRQRGLREAEFSTLLWFADIDVPVARNLHALRLSRNAAQDARAAGVPQRVLNRLSNAVAVESDDGTVVTCARFHGTKAAAYRRRNFRKYWSR